jgi:ribA/ribD-fused uncharacterized protein
MESKMSVIAFTKVKLPYGWLGNMSPHPINYNNKLWPTAESLFQALRYNDESIQDRIHSSKSPMGAKMASKSHAANRIIVPQSQEDVNNMEMVLNLKLEQHPELKSALKATGDKTIIEDCTSRPHGSGLFWGAAYQNGEWVGQNMLGNLWMKLRQNL